MMKQLYSILSFFLFITLFSGCLEDPDMDTTLQNVRVPEVSKPTVEDFTANSVQLSATVLKENGAPIQQYGICWSEDKAISPQENIEQGRKKEGTHIENGQFNVEITALKSNVQYFFYTYAVNKAGLTFSEADSVTTIEGVGIVETLSPPLDSLKATSAFLKALIKKKGEGQITALGFYLSAQKNKTDFVPDTTIHYQPGAGEDIMQIDTFGLAVTGLKVNTKYYVKAFATNEFGAFHSEIDSFATTTGLPQIGMIDTVGAPGFDNVTLKAQLLSEGDSAVTTLGFCWGTSNPNILQSDTIHCVVGEDGYFTGTIGRLESDLRYTVRAFAVNTFGVQYSNGFIDVVTQDVYPSIFMDDPSTYVLKDGVVTLGGELMNQGQTPVTELGIYYSSKSKTPGEMSYEGKKELTLEDLDENGKFKVSIDKLKGNTTYYVRAYAENRAGIKYSKEVQSFTTPAIFSISETNFNINEYKGRLSFSAFSLGNDAFILGGDKGSARTNELHGYNAEHNAWNVFAPYELEATNISVCTNGNTAYTFGGKQLVGGLSKLISSCYSYSGNEWTPLNAKLEGENLRYDAVSFVSGDKVYLIGGKNQYSHPVDTICYYDITTGTWNGLSRFPAPLSNGIALRNGHDVYVGLGDKELNRGFWVSTGPFSLNTWRPLAPLPGTMNNVSTGVVYKNVIYVIDDLGVIWQYRPQENKWSQHATCPSGSGNIKNYKIYVLNDKIYIFGLNYYSTILMTYDPAWDN